jgi:hypothetical protein
MRRFLVCHDYDTGGLWWWIMAKTADEIRTAYRDVVVLDEPPAWWNDDIDRRVARLTISKPDAALALLAR